MFARFIDAFTKPRNPSVILAVGEDHGTIDVLHLHPETGDVERFGISSHSPTFRCDGSRETTREQIGTVTLPAGGCTVTGSFLEDVTAQIRKRWDNSMVSNPSSVESVAQLVQEVLKPATLEVIRERKEGGVAAKETKTHSVYLIYITRPKPGKVVSLEPTSLG
ncbi:hypothetical protein H112_03897 [Trichophyton rubrum D6]|uniref:Uncharacterized protein n=5 Tax=Trichophyton TaxID=5550 RepID=D4B3X8_ARTBC|nr:uncharacterized protein ARB_03167 [Trichophyton benhamiae CBS 112371]EZF23451.1 hypothetical protein H100_03905 [Trichophyton rubrum MR850]EZF42609.1 hypothetical protein H102_03892 [Trichophyton rubrum CBS 100081]EZF53225.1 hypothetical protein H103_03906 [Trichophyton rubrum CBS 288.86]EZF63708.1 hypothetical protein H104_03891 [Trichophyton rubrum CBS 289.86]EZF74213.1 hypothetical protein H105_03919 [Trichophyton soudanense CBS 452.61]EZF85173.1 hypothetical protein H110_03898 [Trichop